ncbi:MAG: ATP-dependent RecD-like DNA helicase [Clostridia bacterium]|nr:ATP-dependent RecD-like DNA helicase [Clostridia bacterium]
MEIRGTVEGLIFRNAENGYTVAAVDAHGLMITAVGIFPPITEGEDVVLVGEYKKNARYGDQFVVSQVIVAPPKSPENMVRYLSGGLFPGVGEVTARSIVRTFGADTFDVIEFNPARLAEVRGISRRKADAITERYVELRKMQRSIMFLTQYHVSLNLAIKIYKHYEDLTESIIKTNPYKLVEDIDGVGFRTADTIALSMGVAKDDVNRVRAGLRHTLDDGANRLGHTYLPYGQVVAMTLKLLEFEEEQANLVMDTLESMEIVGDVKRINEPDGGTGVMLFKHFNREQAIAKRLVQLMQEAIRYHFDYEREIDFFESLYHIRLHPKQREAVTAAMNSGGVVITGGPGTGKTTIIKCIIHLLERVESSYVLTAPTGRAAKRMSEATERVAKTIHRLLVLTPKALNVSYTYNEDNPLPADVIIVDEISMADESIFYALLRAVRRGARLILVGDKDQLPSVGAGCVLADIIESGVMPVVMLDHIYRQQEGSFIITNAHLINKGTLPEPDKTSRDFFFDYTDDESKMLEDVVQFCTKRISTYLDVTPAEIQVLAPLKKGEVGVNHLNEVLQAAVNPPAVFKKEINVGMNLVLREGDRVIQTCNNYDIEWTKEDEGVVTSGTGVFNGDVGVVSAIDRGSMTVTVRFEDDRVAVYGADELSDVSLAYAVSVHKSQGSEFRVVLVVASQYNPMVLNKNLLYTAVTRAKEMVVLVGNKRTFQYMVRNKRTERRYTALVRFIKELA